MGHPTQPAASQTTVGLIRCRAEEADDGMTTATLADRFDEVLTGGPGDLAGFYRDVRQAPPVWSQAFNGWVVSRYHDVRTVLTDEARFGPLGYGAGSSIIHGRTILHMEGDEHRRKGAVLARHLRSTRLLEGP